MALKPVAPLDFHLRMHEPKQGLWTSLTVAICQHLTQSTCLYLCNSIVGNGLLQSLSRWRICLLMQETRVWSPGQQNPLEEEMTTQSSILAWRIPRTEKPSRLQSMRSQESNTTWQLSTHTLFKMPFLYWLLHPHNHFIRQVLRFSQWIRKQRLKGSCDLPEITQLAS